MGFFTKKTVIITGAGRAVLSDGKCGSIGYGIATAFAKEGANLVITGRNVQKLTDAKEELERLYGISVLPVQADVHAGADNAAVVKQVVEQAVAAFGAIHVLINNGTGFRLWCNLGRPHHRTIRSGNVFWSVCNFPLYAGLLSLSERNTGFCH